jgi:hypothetical protein
MRSKIIFIPVMAIIAFVLGLLTLMRGCLSTYDNYGVEGWPATSANNKTTATVTVENKTTSYTQRDGFTAINYASTYYLSAYDNESGQLLKRKKLIELDDLKFKPLKAYGGFNNLLWVFADGLKAFDVNTLEEVVNEQKLAAINPFIANKFPRQQQFIQNMAGSGLINFTSMDGINYQLDLATLKITMQEDVEDKMPMLASFKQNPNFMDDAADFGINTDTIQGHMYALAVSSKNIPATFGEFETGNSNNQRTALYRLGYTVKSFGEHIVLSYKDTLQLNNSTYLNGNFLKDLLNGKAVHLSQPAGFLIMHQNQVGNKANLLLTRIDTANNKLWEANTGVSTKISYCGVNKQYCIIAGELTGDKKTFIGSNGFKIINLQNGNMSSPVLK